MAVGNEHSAVLQLLQILRQQCSATHPLAGVTLLLLLVVLMRYLVSLWPYSGYNTPPTFGDYEAQRHWMEITRNTPITEWYSPTADNNLSYWGLDYPPLTAYHSYICAAVAAAVQQHELVALFTSRGYESIDSKLFMRMTVIVSDLLFYITPVLLIYRASFSTTATIATAATTARQSRTLFALLLTLLAPPLLLIDHGHFQYNCVCLGLTVLAVYLLLPQSVTLDNSSSSTDTAVVCPSLGYQVLGSIAFSCALCFKQIALYYSPAFFCFLLAVNYHTHKQKPLLLLRNITVLGVTVISTFVLLLSPWLSTSIASTQQLLLRVFPFARGLYEDKVANVWSSLSLLIKWHQLFTIPVMMRISAVMTAAAFAPSCYQTLMAPTHHNFLLSLLLCALSFFLLSFQVHEKTILFPLLPLLLLSPHYTLLALYFTLIASFSMFPLLIRDGLWIPYAVMQLMLIVSGISVTHKQQPQQQQQIQQQQPMTLKNGVNQLLQSQQHLLSFYDRYFHAISLSLYASIAVCLLTHAMALLLPHTSRGALLLQRYPDLITYMFTCVSAAHFVAFAAVFNIIQFGYSKRWQQQQLQQKTQ